ncbi:protein of unknown function [Pantoea sesami]|nr:protein of unknown function [Pantoea sesami]
MRKNQDISAEALLNRLKNACQNARQVDVAKQVHIHPGDHYRDERGRMVKVLRVSQLAVEYSREGYRGVSSVGRREFDLKFRKVQP